ncbi:primosomal protein N', partial [Pseudomonas sp. FW306-2-11AA]
YHSKFSDSERVDIWRRLLNSSEPLVVLGARSAVFLPFSQIGLVIVDEEHEASFKQYDPAPRYNARDAALVLASMHGAKSLLGSA